MRISTDFYIRHKRKTCFARFKNSQVYHAFTDYGLRPFNRIIIKCTGRHVKAEDLIVTMKRPTTKGLRPCKRCFREGKK